MTTYDAKGMPQFATSDKIAASGDGLREDLNLISSSASAAIVAEGGRAEAAAKTYTDGKVSVLDSKNAAQDTRLSGVESKNSSQDSALANHETRVGSLETLGGLAPGSVSDATVTDLIANAGTTTAAQLGSMFVRQGDLVVSVKDKAYGAKGDGTTDDTAAIQAAIDHVYAQGGGTVYLPDGAYKVSASLSTEVFSNDGAAVAANTCALVVRPGVSLIGNGRARCKVFATSPTLTLIYMPAAKGSTLAGFELANSYVKGANGAGHGIFTISATNAAIDDTLDCTFYGLYIHGVGSYGLGLQAGNPNNVSIDSLTVENTGADGLDLKARNSAAHAPTGNRCTNVVVRNHGQRVTGSSGIDVRGVWNLSNITVTDFGGDAALAYAGIRFRTKPDGTEPNTVEATNSTLSGFFIEATAGAANAGLDGVASGSDNVHISNGTVRNCVHGIILNGNATGSALRNTVMNVAAINSTSYGFRAVTGVSNAIFVGCTSVASTTAGFRNEGDFTTLIACHSVSETTASTTSSGASPSEIRHACRFSNEYGLTMSSAATGRVNLDARGASTDIDIHFGPKGSGVLRFGNYTAGADAPITGSILIKDASGATRKLAVIA